MAREFAFDVVYASSSDTRRHAEDMTKDFDDGKGWMSKKGSKYPQEIYFDIGGVGNIVKIQTVPHLTNTPTKVEYFVGYNDAVSEDEEIIDLSSVTWIKIGSILFDKEDSFENAQRTLFCDEKGQFLMLRIYENHKKAKNTHNQVGIVEVRIFGYKLNRSAGKQLKHETEFEDPKSKKETDICTCSH